MRFEKLKLRKLREWHGKLYEWWNDQKNKVKFTYYILFPLNPKTYIVGVPFHVNLGDSAIAIAEKKYLVQNGIEKKRIKEISIKEYEKNRHLIRRVIEKDQLIFLHGGGNMGDEWIREELFRRQVLKDFPQNRIICFPQTIYYSNTEKGKKEKQASIPIYNNHKRLTLIAREQKSYEIMKELYPNIPVLLTPDIVLSTDKITWGINEKERKGALLCMRSDAERQITDSQQTEIENIVSEAGYKFQKTDMYSLLNITKENRLENVRTKMNEFSEAELVITDRLHGMVFAAITETPCIVLSNYNQKVEGTYQWIKHLPYVRFAKGTEEIKEQIRDLQKIKKCTFDNGELNKLYKCIKEEIYK